MPAQKDQEMGLRKRQQSYPPGPPPWVTQSRPPIPSPPSPSDDGDDNDSSAPTSIGDILSSTAFAISLPTTLSTTFTLGPAAPSQPSDLTDSTPPTSTTSDSSNTSSDGAIVPSTYSFSSATTPSITFTPTKPGWYTQTIPTDHPTSTTSPYLPNPQPDYAHPSADRAQPDHTTLIAGVAIPILILLLGVLLLAFLLRRRRNRSPQPSTTTTTLGITPAILPIPFTKEKKRMSSIATTTTALPIAPPHMQMQTQTQHPHIVTSAQNTSYFSGLDTLSMHSSDLQASTTLPLPRTSQDPPPPYRPRSTFSHGGAAPSFVSSDNSPPSPVLLYSSGAAHEGVSPLMPLREGGGGDGVSPFEDPDAATGYLAASGVFATAVTRTPSARSITSTLYSSNASVISARPARRSVGGAYMVEGMQGGDERSPFADPESDEE